MLEATKRILGERYLQLEKYEKLLLEHKNCTKQFSSNTDPNAFPFFVLEAATARKMLDINRKEAEEMEKEVFGKSILIEENSMGMY